MAYRLGSVLYWACVGLAIVLVAVWVLSCFTDLAPLPLLIQVLFFWLPALLLYELGRAYRYVLAGD